MKTPFRYNATNGYVYSGTAKLELVNNVWHGKILTINDLVTYESKTRDGLFEAFCDAVEDWLETRRSI